MIGYMIFTVTAALAICAVSYDTFARARGWPVGEVFAKDASFVKLFAVIAGIWAVGKSFFVLHWWSPLVVLVLGWLLAFIITLVFKSWTQFLVFLVFPLFVLTILYLSESKPFGMLHGLFG